MRTISNETARRLFIQRQRLNDPAPANDAAGILQLEKLDSHLPEIGDIVVPAPRIRMTMPTTPGEHWPAR